MAWRDNLRPASFRGVPFFVDVSELEGGRRTVVHEFPFRDLPPYVEDLGPGAKSHALDAYVLGDDFAAVRDQLQRALEEEGSGTLVHPHLGSLVVAALPYRLRHSTSEGRMARFGLIFLETAPPLTVTQSPDTQGQAAKAAAALTAGAAANFDDVVETREVPGFVFQQTIAEAQRFVDKIREALTGPDLSDFAALTDALNELGNGIVDVVRGGDFPQRAADELARFEEAFTSTEAAIDFYLELDSHRAERIGYASAAALLGDRNALAFERLMRESAIAAAARLAAANTWDSFEDALAMRELLLLRIEALEEEASDASYRALLSLRAKLVAALPPEDESLPRLELVRPRATTSTILLAYRRFGEISKEPEIARRNRTPFPGFLTPAEEYEVLVEA